MDTFTKEGVPWLLPIPFKFGVLPVRDLRITTGHAVESFVVFPGLMVLVGYLVVANYQQLLNLLHQIH
jgi:hypothetical protein